MSYSASDPSQTTRAIEQLQRRTDALSSDLDELREKQEQLDGQSELHDGRLDDMDQAVRELREEQEELHEELQEHLDEVRAEVRAVASAVGWLQRRVRAAQTITPVELDTVDDTVHRLAVRAQRGRQSEAILLTPEQRRGHERRIEALRTLQERIQQNTAQALRHSAAAAATDFGTQAHTQAGTGYRQAIGAVAADQAQLAGARSAAEQARQALDRDDQQRAIHGPHVMTGESARSVLESRLRDRIATAVGAGELLPVWFTTVLGYQPPATGTDAWLRTATSLLMYRITYAVTDSVVALGAVPTGEDAHRVAWHRELSDALRRQRQWPS